MNFWHGLFGGYLIGRYLNPDTKENQSKDTNQSEDNESLIDDEMDWMMYVFFPCMVVFFIPFVTDFAWYVDIFLYLISAFLFIVLLFLVVDKRSLLLLVLWPITAFFAYCFLRFIILIF